MGMQVFRSIKWDTPNNTRSDKHLTNITVSDRLCFGDHRQCHGAPQGRLLMKTVGLLEEAVPLVMDRAYEDDLSPAHGVEPKILPRGSPEIQPRSPLGTRCGAIQAAQRDREAVPPYAGFPPHLLQVLKAGRDVYRVYTAGLGLCLNVGTRPRAVLVSRQHHVLRDITVVHVSG